MSALNIRLLDSLHERVWELALREGISMNQLIATALAEKMSAIMTADYLEARARRGSRAKFLAALSHVPDVERETRDRLQIRASNNRMQRSRSGSQTSRGKRVSRIGPRR